MYGMVKPSTDTSHPYNKDLNSLKSNNDVMSEETGRDG